MEKSTEDSGDLLYDSSEYMELPPSYYTQKMVKMVTFAKHTLHQ